MSDPRCALLIRLLQAAYSGERAAALAYRGHWRSVTSPAVRDRIREIERDEWRHREQVGQMLHELGAGPRRISEMRAAAVGHGLGALCHIAGRLLPLYGAGMLESKNVREYERAARLAHRAGYPEWVDCLLEMAEVEWDHEAAFRALVIAHPVGRRLPLWAQPPPRDTIRRAFERELTAGRSLAVALTP